ncbi:MAG: hypothetical protein IPI58_07055 [Alphaproteobacteria bacterium]|nr:MAG: hypothetical protein IPI58_07055 [Alphaproteobacteria bacterium]
MFQKEEGPAPIIWDSGALWRGRLARGAMVLAAMASGALLPSLWPQISLRMDPVAPAAKAAALQVENLALPAESLADPRLEHAVAALPPMTPQSRPSANPARSMGTSAPRGLTVHVADEEEPESIAAESADWTQMLHQAIKMDQAHDRAGALSLYLQVLATAENPDAPGLDDIRARAQHLRDLLESTPSSATQ